MAEPDAREDEGAAEAFVLPPREPSALARYSRRSKMMTAGLSLTGCISVMFLLAQLLANSGINEPAKRHVPKIVGAENENHATPFSNEPNAKKGAAVDDIVVINQQDDRHIRMTTAPDPSVTENTPSGDLPRISEDGRLPWQVYSRPFNVADKRPRIAILVTDLGLQRSMTDEAVSHLPANVTLAFDVQSPAVGSWCARARQEGHEILLSVPMEPFDFPQSDPGPRTLLTTLDSDANIDKLTWAMRQATGYIGITTTTGSRFTSETDKLKPVMESLQSRGLIMFDARIAPHSVVADLGHDVHVPVAVANARIDDTLSPEAIDNELQQLEQAARLNGKAVGVIAPLPILIDHLERWLKTLPQQGIALAPVSAIVQ